MKQGLHDENALHSSLDEREYLILLRLVRGVSLKDMAHEIGEAPEQAQQMKLAMMEKLSAASTADLVRIGLQAGIDQPA